MTTALPVAVAFLLGIQLGAGAPATQNPETELARLAVSQKCADAAAAFWQRGGYDKPSSPDAGAERVWSYGSHYNRALGRCLIAVRSVTIDSATGRITTVEEVADAVEGGEPIASHFLPQPTGVEFLMRGNQRIELSEENMSWFRALMTE